MVVNVAHRGDSGNRPENTLAAFAAAIEIGADQIELDVGLSRDGELVVIHDATIDRTTNGQGAVGQMTLAELKAVDAGSWFSAEYVGEKLPTLAEALSVFPEWMGLNCHTKCFDPDSDEHERQVVQALADAQMIGRTVIATDYLGSLMRFRQLAPELDLRSYPDRSAIFTTTLPSVRNTASRQCSRAGI